MPLDSTYTLRTIQSVVKLKTQTIMSFTPLRPYCTTYFNKEREFLPKIHMRNQFNSCSANNIIVYNETSEQVHENGNCKSEIKCIPKEMIRLFKHKLFSTKFK